MALAYNREASGRYRLSNYICRCGIRIKSSTYVCKDCDTKNKKLVVKLAYLLHDTEPKVSAFLLRMCMKT